MDVGRIAALLRDYFTNDAHGAVAVYVFGSVARGTARTNSDLDVGILFGETPPETLEGLPTDLQDDLSRVAHRPVDLVILNHAPADLIHRVLRDGVLVFEGDRSARIRFEVCARNHFFDILPVLREYRRPRLANKVVP